jgi:hypothetical protein
MKLTKDGITKVTNDKIKIEKLKKQGFVEIVEKEVEKKPARKKG